MSVSLSTATAMSLSQPHASAAAQGSINGRQSVQPQRSTLNEIHDMRRVVALFDGTHGERKFYCQGYVWKRTELNNDGKPLHQDDPASRWDLWFIQLNGVDYSLWNAREMQQAAQRGESIGPQFFRIQHANVTVADPKQVQPPAPDCPFVFALNSVGSNRVLFAPVPDRDNNESPELALRKWVNCTRLAAWETARLNEIFTGTMLGLRGDQFCQSPLQNGRFEEAVEVMLPGDPDWRKVFMVVQDHTVTPKQKKRLSFLPASSSSSSIAALGDGPNATASLYANRKAKKPFFTFNLVRHVAALYPENHSMIPQSAVFKIEGMVDWDAARHAELPAGLDLQARRLSSRAAAPKGEPWDSIMVMPSSDGQNHLQVLMLKWILAICDAFRLYGRKPPLYKFSFQPRGAQSIYLGYPIGATRDQLYHEIDLDPSAPGFSAIRDLDPRENRPSVIDAELTRRLVERVSRGLPNTSEKPPAQPKSAPVDEKATLPAPPVGLQQTNGRFTPPQATQAQESRDLRPNGVYQPLPAASKASSERTTATSFSQPQSVRTAFQTLHGSAPATTPTSLSLATTRSDDGKQLLGSTSSSRSGTPSQYPAYSTTSNSNHVSNQTSSPPDDLPQRPTLPALQTQPLQAQPPSAAFTSQFSPADTSASAYSQTTGKTPTSQPLLQRLPSLPKNSPHVSALGLDRLEPRQTHNSPEPESEKSLPSESMPEPPAKQLPGALPGLASTPDLTPPEDRSQTVPLPQERSTSDLGHNADALAAFSFLERPASPTFGPVDPPASWSVAPLSTNRQARPAAVKVSRFQQQQQQQPPSPVTPTSPDYYQSSKDASPVAPLNTSAFRSEGPSESTFERSKRLEVEREAAARSAQESQSHALHRPGRSKAAGTNKLGSYSSDEDEEPEENSDDEEPIKPLPAPIAQPSPARRVSRTLPIPPKTGGSSLGGRPISPNGSDRTSAYGGRSVSGASQRPDDLGYSQRGLLHAGVQQQAEHSARAQESQARAYGAPMIDIPPPQAPPTSGLVAAIAEREKERKRDGGIGASMTQRERERQQLDQELADSRRASTMGDPFMQPQGFMNMNPMMFNPFAMGGQPEQMQMVFQQQAMFAAQQAYMQTMQMQMMALQQQQQGASQVSGSRSTSPAASPPMPFQQPFPTMPISPYMGAQAPYFNGYASYGSSAPGSASGSPQPQPRPHPHLHNSHTKD